jgi:plastocyanin
MRSLALSAVVAAVLLSACSSSTDGVVMNGGQSFVPREITVKAGDTLTFTNEGSAPHTVTAYEDAIPDGADYFSSGEFASESAARDDPSGGFVTEGETFEVTLDTPGTYEYFCIPHEQQGMTGTIVVEA